MKLQRLTESIKSELDEQSTLKSELSKKETLIEMLRKENEVNIVIRVVCFYSNVDINTVGCNTAARGLTDIYTQSQGRTPSEGECECISKNLISSVLQRLCNIFNSRVLHCS